MNRREAKEIVYRLTAKSLRRIARTPWDNVRDIPKDLTEAGKAKVQMEMTALADKLEAKFEEKEPIEGEKG